MRTAIIGAVAGIAALTVVASAGLASGLVKVNLPWARSTCTVGYAGTDMNVTIEGIGADKECRDLSTGQDQQVTEMAVYGTNPSGTLICRYAVNDLTYTVRDTGMLKLYGNQECDAIHETGMPILGSNATPGPTAGKIPG